MPGSPGVSAAKPPDPGLLYRFLRLLVRLVLRIFYRTIEVTGLENLDPGQPTILASNHPNSIIDPLILGIFGNRQVSFCARDGLFKIPGFGALLRAVGAIPIYRPSDHPGQEIDNTRAFSAARAVLERGGVLAIFPEGRTHGHLKVEALKTGIARIALDAERQGDYALGVRIVPVSLNFLVRQAFRSDVHVALGTPLQVTDELAAADRQDQWAAVRQMTDSLGEALKGLAVHIERQDDELVIAQVTSMIVDIRSEQGLDADGQSPSERTALVQRIVDAYQWYAEIEPRHTADLYRRLSWFVSERQRLGFGGSVPALQHRSDVLRHRVAKMSRGRRLFMGVLSLPLAVYGLACGLVPYAVLRLLLAVIRPVPERMAFFKLLVGGALATTTLAAQTYMAWLYLGDWAAVVLALTWAPASLIALRYTTELKLHRLSLRVLMGGLRDGRLAVLRAERAKLVEDLQELRERYLKERG